MLHPIKTALLGIVALAVFTPPASADMPDPAEVFLSGRVSIGGSYLLRTGSQLGSAGRDEFDYAVFVRELVAFIAKEVLPDAGEEYVDSEIPSRLSASMPHQ
ncbi:MAG: hypothetical protein ACREQY_16925, partial [Candidatus Binatia bacterium]